MSWLCKKLAPSPFQASHALLLSAAFGLAPIAMAQTAPQVTVDATNVYYKIPYSSTPTWVRVFIDADRNAATGFIGNTIGASHLIENGRLYRYSGTGGAWGWTFVKNVSSTVGSGVANVTIARTDLGSPSAIDAVTQTDPPKVTSAKLSATLTAAAPAPTTTTTTPSTTSTTKAATTTTQAATTTTRAATTTTQAATTTTRAATTTTQAATTTTRAATTTTQAATTTTKAATTTTTTASTTTTTLAATGPTYYLSPTGNDANPGSQSAPWRTIQKAANTVVAGDTVVLLNGSYEEPTVSFSRSGTSSKPITFVAQNKWQAILSSTSGCQPGFSIRASYITVKNIRLSVSPRNVQCGIYTSSNVDIRAWSSTQPTPSNPTTGIAGFVADGIKIDAGLARAVGVKSNQDFTIIQNSEANNALELLNSKNSIIRNNVVTGQDKFGVSIFAKGGVRNAQIYNNVVYNKVQEGLGIYLGGYSCDTCFFDTSTKIEAYNSVAYNNVVVNQSGGRMYGLIFAGAKDSAFFNNVVIGGQVFLLEGGHNSGIRAPTTNPTFRNNIVTCNANATGWTGQYTGTLSIDSNNFYGCSGVPAQANAVVGDPLLVNQASDWHLQLHSPALNRGAAASIIGYDGMPIDVSRDRNGVVRTAPWDLGIYNY